MGFDSERGAVERAEHRNTSGANDLPTREEVIQDEIVLIAERVLEGKLGALKQQFINRLAVLLDENKWTREHEYLLKNFQIALCAKGAKKQRRRLAREVLNTQPMPISVGSSPAPMSAPTPAPLHIVGLPRPPQRVPVRVEIEVQTPSLELREQLTPIIDRVLQTMDHEIKAALDAHKQGEAKAPPAPAPAPAPPAPGPREVPFTSRSLLAALWGAVDEIEEDDPPEAKRVLADLIVWLTAQGASWGRAGALAGAIEGLSEEVQADLTALAKAAESGLAGEEYERLRESARAALNAELSCAHWEKAVASVAAEKAAKGASEGGRPSSAPLAPSPAVPKPVLTLTGLKELYELLNNTPPDCPLEERKALLAHLRKVRRGPLALSTELDHALAEMDPSYLSGSKEPRAHIWRETLRVLGREIAASMALLDKKPATDDVPATGIEMPATLAEGEGKGQARVSLHEQAFTLCFLRGLHAALLCVDEDESPMKREAMREFARVALRMTLIALPYIARLHLQAYIEAGGCLFEDRRTARLNLLQALGDAIKDLVSAVAAAENAPYKEPAPEPAPIAPAATVVTPLALHAMRGLHEVVRHADDHDEAQRTALDTYTRLMLRAFWRNFPAGINERLDALHAAFDASAEKRYAARSALLDALSGTIHDAMVAAGAY